MDLSPPNQPDLLRTLWAALATAISVIVIPFVFYYRQQLNQITRSNRIKQFQMDKDNEDRKERFTDWKTRLERERVASENSLAADKAKWEDEMKQEEERHAQLVNDLRRGLELEKFDLKDQKQRNANSRSNFEVFQNDRLSYLTRSDEQANVNRMNILEQNQEEGNHRKDVYAHQATTMTFIIQNHRELKQDDWNRFALSQQANANSLQEERQTMRAQAILVNLESQNRREEMKEDARLKSEQRDQEHTQNTSMLETQHNLNEKKGEREHYQRMKEKEFQKKADEDQRKLENGFCILM